MVINKEQTTDTNYRISVSAIELIYRIASDFEHTQGGVVNLAVRHLAERKDFVLSPRETEAGASLNMRLRASVVDIIHRLANQFDVNYGEVVGIAVKELGKELYHEA